MDIRSLLWAEKNLVFAEPMIFISYVRSDAKDQARRLQSALAELVGQHGVFLDVRSIEAGSQWSAQIDRALDSALMFVLVVGPDFRSASLPRLHDESSVVTREIKRALDRHLPIVPVISGSYPPSPAELPAYLSRLSDLHWDRISEEPGAGEIRELVERIAVLLARPEIDRVSASKDDRLGLAYEAMLKSTAALRSAILVGVEAHQVHPEVRRAFEAVGYVFGSNPPFPARDAGDHNDLLALVHRTSPSNLDEQTLRKILRLARGVQGPRVGPLTQTVIDAITIAFGAALENRYVENHGVSARCRELAAREKRLPSGLKRRRLALRKHLASEVLDLSSTDRARLIALESLSRFRSVHMRSKTSSRQRPVRSTNEKRRLM